MITAYLSLDRMTEFIKQENNCSEIARIITDETGKPVTRQWVHKIYQKHKKENPEVFQKIEDEKTPNKATVKALIDEGLTIKEICKSLDLSYPEIMKLFKKHGLEKKTLVEKLNYDTVYNLYVLEGLTDKQIAKKFNCSQYTVTILRQKHEIFIEDKMAYAELKKEEREVNAETKTK